MTKEISHGLKSGFLAHALPSVGTGRIHSLFANSFNAQFGSQLIHFGKAREGISSFGLTMEEGVVEEMLASLQVDDRVSVRFNRLTVYTRQTIWQVQLDRLTEADCRVLELPMLAPAVWEKASGKLEQMPLQQKSGIGEESENLTLLQQFLEKPFEEEAFQRDFMKHFIGRGIGLTPSGDDMLMGFVMLCQAFGQYPEWQKLLEQVLQERSTTAVSEAYYQALQAGYASSQFVALLRSFQSPDLSGWDEAVDSILRYGHTSGWDTLVGVDLFVKKQLREVTEHSK